MQNIGRLKRNSCIHGESFYSGLVLIDIPEALQGTLIVRPARFYFYPKIKHYFRVKGSLNVLSGSSANLFEPIACFTHDDSLLPFLIYQNKAMNMKSFADPGISWILKNSSQWKHFQKAFQKILKLTFHQTLL